MRLLKKGIIISIIIIFIMQIFSPVVMADDMVVDPDLMEELLQGDDRVQVNDISGTLSGATEALKPAADATIDQSLSWGLGVLYLPFQYIIGIVTTVLELIAEGVTGKDSVTPQDVLFNEVAIVDINFFKLGGSSETFVNTVRESVASWYYGIRTIAIIASLCVLIYIGIRMVIASTGEEKGKFKSMFKDWLISFVLLFVLHYIMMLVIYGNNALVDVFKTALTTGETQTILTEYMKSMRELKWSIDVTIPVAQKFGANIVCLLMAGLTLGFIIMYLKRFIVVAFLMMIAPIITITYAIDKVKDSQSQALDSWIKEFFWTIVIQPFHCLIYLVFVPAALKLVQNADVGSAFMAIFCMTFILQAESIVKNIFGIKADDIGGLSAASALVAGGVIGSMRKAKAPIAAAVNNTKGGNENKNRGPQTQQNSPNPTPSPTSGENQGDGRDSGEWFGWKGDSGTGSDTGNWFGWKGDQNGGAGQQRNTNSNNQQQGGGQPDGNSGAPTNARLADSEKVQNSMEKFAEAIRGSKTVGLVGKVINGYTKAGFGLAGGALSLLDNPDGAKFFASYMAGSTAGGAFIDGMGSVKNWGADKLQAKVEESRLNNREIDFNNAYNAFKNESIATPEQNQKRIQELLTTDLQSTLGQQLSETEKNMATTVQRLYDQLEKMNYEDPFEEVMDRVRKKENIE